MAPGAQLRVGAGCAAASRPSPAAARPAGRFSSSSGAPSPAACGLAAAGPRSLQVQGRRRAVLSAAAASSPPPAGAAAGGAPPPLGGVRWASAMSQHSDLERALEQAVKAGLKALGPGPPPEVALVFVSGQYNSQVDGTVALLRRRLPSLKHVFGCSVRAAAAAAVASSSRRCVLRSQSRSRRGATAACQR